MLVKSEKLDAVFKKLEEYPEADVICRRLSVEIYPDDCKIYRHGPYSFIADREEDLINRIRWQVIKIEGKLWAI